MPAATTGTSKELDFDFDDEDEEDEGGDLTTAIGLRIFDGRDEDDMPTWTRTSPSAICSDDDDLDDRDDLDDEDERRRSGRGDNE